MIGKGHTNQINKMYIQENNLISCAKDDSIRVTPLNSKEYRYNIIKKNI